MGIVQIVKLMGLVFRNSEEGRERGGEGRGPRRGGRGRERRSRTARKERTKRESIPPPYVCPIFRQEIASFLPRAKIEEWRLVSRFSNRALAEFPNLLPHVSDRRLRIFTVGLCYEAPAPFTHSVFHFFQHTANGVPGSPMVLVSGVHGGRAFQSTYKFRFCCKELKVGALLWLVIGNRM